MQWKTYSENIVTDACMQSEPGTIKVLYVKTANLWKRVSL